MKLEKIIDQIYHVDFPSQYLLTSTFLRFQEAYESPKFKDKQFTLEEFADWYAKKHGNFTYYKDWEGFNVPSCAFKPFYDGKFDPLSKKEQKLLETLKEIKEEFYIIGTYGNDKQTLKHEIAHGLFAINPDYRNEVMEQLNQVPKTQIYSVMKKIGDYHPAVYYDEFHAYVLADLKVLKTYGVNVEKYRNLSGRLNRLFKKYFNNSLKK